METGVMTVRHDFNIDLCDEVLDDLLSLVMLPPCFSIVHDLGDFARLDSSKWLAYETQKSIAIHGPLGEGEERKWRWARGLGAASPSCTGFDGRRPQGAG